MLHRAFLQIDRSLTYVNGRLRGVRDDYAIVLLRHASRVPRNIKVGEENGSHMDEG